MNWSNKASLSLLQSSPWGRRLREIFFDNCYRIRWSGASPVLAVAHQATHSSLACYSYVQFHSTGWNCLPGPSSGLWWALLSICLLTTLIISWENPNSQFRTFANAFGQLSGAGKWYVQKLLFGQLLSCSKTILVNNYSVAAEFLSVHTGGGQPWAHTEGPPRWAVQAQIMGSLEAPQSASILATSEKLSSLALT